MVGQLLSTPLVRLFVEVCDESHLRIAISAAGPGGNVTFSRKRTISLGATIAFDSASSGLTIDGTGRSVTISGGNRVQVFRINPGVTVTLTHLTVAHGNGPGLDNVGGVYNAGTLSLADMTLTANSGSGAIVNHGTINVINTTFSDNSAGLACGAAYNTGTLNVSNSTFLRGSGANAGGGIDGPGRLHVTNSTFVDNTASGNGGAINGSPGGVVTN